MYIRTPKCKCKKLFNMLLRAKLTEVMHTTNSLCKASKREKQTHLTVTAYCQNQKYSQFIQQFCLKRCRLLCDNHMTSQSWAHDRPSLKPRLMLHCLRVVLRVRWTCCDVTALTSHAARRSRGAASAEVSSVIVSASPSASVASSWSVITIWLYKCRTCMYTWSYSFTLGA